MTFLIVNGRNNAHEIVKGFWKEKMTSLAYYRLCKSVWQSSSKEVACQSGSSVKPF